MGFIWHDVSLAASTFLCDSMDVQKDYAEANLKMLPLLEPEGNSTIRQIFWHLLLMIQFQSFGGQGSLRIVYLFGAFNYAYFCFSITISSK